MSVIRSIFVCAGASGVSVVLPGDGGQSGARARREVRGQWRYLGWLLLFSAVSEVPYRMYIPDPDTLNVLPTLALGLLVARAGKRRGVRRDCWRSSPWCWRRFSGRD
jgi:hypothetical protein